MKVRIVVRPTGLLNGREWPDVGGTIDLPDVVADGMAASGHVEAVSKDAKTLKVETRPANTDDVETRTEAPVKRGPGRPRKDQG